MNMLETNVSRTGYDFSQWPLAVSQISVNSNYTTKNKPSLCNIEIKWKLIFCVFFTITHEQLTTFRRFLWLCLQPFAVWLPCLICFHKSPIIYQKISSLCLKMCPLLSIISPLSQLSNAGRSFHLSWGWRVHLQSHCRSEGTLLACCPRQYWNQTPWRLWSSVREQETPWAPPAGPWTLVATEYTEIWAKGKWPPRESHKKVFRKDNIR